MRFLFVANTPAQAHLFRNPATRLSAAGHETLVVARDYGCTVELLSYHDVPHVVANSAGMSQLSVLTGAPRHLLARYRAARRFAPDVAFGMGADAALVGAALDVPVVLVVDSEPDGLDHAISKRLATALLTPEAFEKDLGAKQYRFPGFKESAYLHPDTYDPDPSVRGDLDLKPDERFVVFRFNAWGAHHDVARSGFDADERRALVTALAEHATVLVSDESFEGESHRVDGPARAFDVHPARMHDVLAEADLLVADTQTMVTEAALLGTPAVRSNSFVGDDDMGNFRALERAGLVYNVRRTEEVREVALELLRDDAAAARWAERRDEYVADTVNLTDLLVAVAETGGEMSAVASRPQWSFGPGQSV